MSLRFVFCAAFLAVAACDPVKSTPDLDGGADSGVPDGSPDQPDGGPVCGDGIRDPGEDCDKTDLGGRTCKDKGFPSGTLACTADCDFDTTACFVPAECGNGAIDGTEQCDGALLNDKTCKTQGFFTGTLTCGGGCQFDTSACSNCGNNTIEAPEPCDGSNLAGKTCLTQGMFSGGTLTCNSTCTAFVTTACTGAPTVPVLARPAPNAYVGSALVAGTSRPKFGWRASTVAGNVAIRYDLQYSADKAFPAAGTTTVANLTVLDHLPASDLDISRTAAPVGRRYFWHVRACAGNACSAYSPARVVNVGRSDHDFNGDGYADLAVGASGFTSGTAAGAGRVVVYFGPKLLVAGSRTIAGKVAGDQVGHAVTGADVNGDGFTDLVLGIPKYDAGAVDSGQVAIYKGSAAFDTDPDFQVFGAVKADQLGNHIAVGDFNGDGYADVVTATPGHDTAVMNSGRVDVYLGADVLDTTADRTYVDDPGKANIGFGMGAADLDGDGYDELVSPACDPAPIGCANSVRVFRGGPGLLPQTASYSFSGLNHAEIAGDTNGDGYQDLLGWLSVGPTPYISTGKPSGAPTSVALQPGLGYNGTALGSSRASIGDINRDGFDDVILGDYSQASSLGVWYVYFGHATGLETKPSGLGLQGVSPAGNLGFSVCGGGDVNGDAVADWASGAVNEDTATVKSAGRVHVYFGANGTTPTNAEDLSAEGQATGERFGNACSL